MVWVSPVSASGGGAARALSSVRANKLPGTPLSAAELSQLDSDDDGAGDVCDPSGPICTPAPDPDLDDDGWGTVLDLSIIASCLGQDPSQPQCTLADVDCSGSVDMLDFGFVLSGFGQSGF